MDMTEHRRLTITLNSGKNIEISVTKVGGQIEVVTRSRDEDFRITRPIGAISKGGELLLYDGLERSHLHTKDGRIITRNMGYIQKIP